MAFHSSEHLTAADLLGEVEAFEPGKILGLRAQTREVEASIPVMRDDTVRHARLADARGQAPGIDAESPGMLWRFSQRSSVQRRAIIGRAFGMCANHETAAPRA